MSTGNYSQLDNYALLHLTEHLYQVGDKLFSDLYSLTTSQEWFNTHDNIDPTHQTYIESIEWGIRAAEEDRTGLPVLLVLTLLHTTISTLSANIPTTAIESLAFLEQYEQVSGYIELQGDAVSKCEALCKVSLASWKNGDLDHARKCLEQAQLSISNLPPDKSRAHALGVIANSARETGMKEMYRESILGIQNILKNNSWQSAIAAQNYDLLDKPTYLLDLVDWDDPKKNTLSSQFYINEKEAIPVIVKTAAQHNDQNTLHKFLTRAKDYYSISSEIVIALTEADCIEKALKFIEYHQARFGDSVYIYEAMARAAGKKGDLNTIQRIASISLESNKNIDTSNKFNEEPLDWDDRIENLKDKLTEKFDASWKKLVGKGLLGVEWNYLMILIAGIEGLSEQYPEKVNTLWNNLKRDTSWFGRKLAKPTEAVILAITDPDHHKKPDRLIKVFENLIRIASRSEDITQDETLSFIAETRVMFGDYEGASQIIEKIVNSEDKDYAVLSLIDGYLKRGYFDKALVTAKLVSKQGNRKIVLERISQFLISQPVVDVEAYIYNIFTLAKYLSEEEYIHNSPVFIQAWIITTSQKESVGYVCKLMEKEGIEINLNNLAALSYAANSQQDIEGARRILEEAKYIVSNYSAIWNSIKGSDVFSNFAKQVDQLNHLSEIVVQFVQAAGKSNSKRSSYWIELASQVYQLAQTLYKNKVFKDNNGCILPLSRAARYLSNRKELLSLLKKASKGNFSGRSDLDQALVHIALGLTLTGDYISPGNIHYLPAIEAIKAKHYKAQALAEMSCIVRETQPQAKLFGRVLSKEFLEERAKFLIKNARQELGLPQFRPSSIPISRTGLTFQTKFSPIISTSSKTKLTPLPTPMGSGSTSEALSSVVSIFAKEGMYEDVFQIATQLTPSPDKPQVLSAAVQSLTECGQYQLNDNLIGMIHPDTEKALAFAKLAEVQAPNKTKEVTSMLINQVFPRILQSTYQKDILLSCSMALTSMPHTKQLDLITNLLSNTRQHGRAYSITVIAALAPLLANLMDKNKWEEMTNKLFETDTWW
jgi:hypothetical protein